MFCHVLRPSRRSGKQERMDGEAAFKVASELCSFSLRWEVEHGDETYSSFTDRWWARPEESSRWGEKKRVVHTRLKRKSEEEEMEGAEDPNNRPVACDKVEVCLSFQSMSPCGRLACVLRGHVWT